MKRLSASKVKKGKALIAKLKGILAEGEPCVIGSSPRYDKTYYSAMKMLPMKASELIMLALKDLNDVRQDEKYRVDMSVWHAPSQARCFVCLAGAVMAKSLNFHLDRWVVNLKEGEDLELNEKQLKALAMFRMGNAYAGLETLGEKDIKLPSRYWFIPEYTEDSPEEFFMAMTDMANDLALAGY